MPQAWQVLPLVPPETDYWSPYTGLDALCGNPMLIDIDDLITRGLLDPEDRPAEARPIPCACPPALSSRRNPPLGACRRRVRGCASARCLGVCA